MNSETERRIKTLENNGASQEFVMSARATFSDLTAEELQAKWAKERAKGRNTLLQRAIRRRINRRSQV